MKSWILAAGIALTMSPAGADEGEVPYPDGYRHWHHVKSMVIEEGHPLHAAFGGIHHIYANDEALRGYRSDVFPDGAVLVFDLLEAERADHAVTEGARKVVGVMHKNAARYPNTGGWGFEGFAAGDPDARVVGSEAESACFSCHAPLVDSDYVFSRLRD